MEIQKNIFLTKLKGHSNLFVTGEFLYSQYRNKEDSSKGTENLFLYRRIFVKSVFVRTIFDCIYEKQKRPSLYTKKRIKASRQNSEEHGTSVDTR